ncbi:ankyrin repeat protein [Ancylostoma caninum]|nr:ankyrin repeat protein [Ancylostoma caninum]
MYKTPLMGLLLLKCKDVNLNAKNNAGQTPLHIFTHKGEIGLMVTLLSYCCDIDAQDYDGNTALHVAVSKKNIEV